MAGGSLYQDDDGGAITEINVTPFVDVVLVLLIIFMVTAKMIVARGVEADLPKAATGGPVPIALRLSVKADGSVYVNDQPVTDDAAAIAQIKALAAAMPKAKAVIAGDRAAAYAGVMRAIDLAKRAEVPIALENLPLDGP
ncbi:MAG: biopolymer transporter ExbD [Kofleriaceae bacterium]|jgi:biopolymer transport protein TolR|nr:biopolymer transporter ExbD [Kofleriaceae bacterium]MBP6839829.1 biopolymer transporter ExbD [Kofleriaceae bacterium]MBP9206611.1 biopolymer transporter ExbD [Kofleriaceae bacterium]